MTSETGSEPESPKRRGRIPQSAWPEIVERYRSGATLSAIAREFSCTPSAISYIVRKAEASGAEGVATEEPAAAAEAAEQPRIQEAAPEAPAALEPAPSVVEEPAAAPQPAQASVTPAPVAASAAAQPAAPRPAARPEPAPPIDEVEGRLRETARTCLVAYRGWRQVPGETTIQTLADSVHELRKVLARIEIDMSASRREEQALRPIPIPAHRSVRRLT